VVGIADRRVQLGQVITVGLDHLGGRDDPRAEDIGIHGN
jgi:hypothetical protein